MGMQLCHAQEIKGTKPAWFKKEKNPNPEYWINELDLWR